MINIELVRAIQNDQAEIYHWTTKFQFRSYIDYILL